MARLADLALKIRSKNAGPFWVTVDIFFASASAFESVRKGLLTERVADVLQLESAAVKRFELADISVIKFSFVRPVVQGSRSDRDMHGAQYAWLLADLEVSASTLK